MRVLLIPLLLASFAIAEVEVVRHDLVVEIDPATSKLTSRDTVTLRGPGTLKVTALEGISVEPAEIEIGEGEQTVTVTFSGVVNNPVEKSTAATWVSGDRTAGTIGKQGSYLVRGFYVPSARPVPFKTTVRVPLPHRAVVPGRRTAESEQDGMYEVTCETSYGLDGLVLVTGPWVVQEEKIDGISCRTYLAAEDQKYAGILLSSLREEIPHYQKLLGPVPDGRFDVVGNFFTTGYGFPNFTLLGNNVIRYVSAKAMRSRSTRLPSGYLDHELVHCWLGNYLHVDYAKGNWCEALTTWYSNYGSAVREGRDVAYRKKVSRTFSLRVFGDRDYPLREFRSKRQDFENDIGYGKGSMVFHMLEREIGKQVLLDAVRHVLATKGGQALGWDGFVAALSEGAGRDLKPWFAPWLDRPGAPILRLGTVHVDGNTVTGTILQTQEGAAFPVRVPIVSDAGEEQVVYASSKESVFRVTFAAAPRTIRLDPDHHVFRRVPRADVAPCLEAVLTAERKVGVGDPALLKRMGVESIEPALPKDAGVLLLGVPENLRKEVFAGARRQHSLLQIADDHLQLGGVKYDQPGDGVLLTYNRPEAPPVTFFHGLGEPAFARLAYLPYYASHGWVLFRNGRPIQRGEFAGDRANTRTPSERPGAPMERDLLRITDDKWEGRRAGTAKSYQLANELRGRLFQTGAKVLPWPGVAVRSGAVLEKPTLEVAGKTFGGPLFPFHWSGDAARGVTCERVVAHPSDRAEGALVVMPAAATYEEMAKVADAGAAAILVVGDLQKRGNEAAWLNCVPPTVRTAGRNMDTTIAGLFARSAQKPLTIPVLLGTVEAQAFAAEGPVTLRMSLKRTTSATSNLVGVFGEAKKPGVLLGAHWDGVGMVDGRPSQGASDNAAGVAIVLWVAEQLKRDADEGRLGKPVVIALFGAEEAGLVGSRQFVAALNHPQCPIAKPEVVINVDAIGGGKDRTVYVIGRSQYPALFGILEPLLKKNGLPVGRDIDKFAYRLGSDHWPFHEAGVPAISIFGTNYRTMNTPADTLDRVDVGMLREVARVVYRSVRELAK
ncbi:MAG: M28 family peptidase [Planctomycetota bacterium]